MFIKYAWPGIVWTLFIITMTLLPGDKLPASTLWEWDKLIHAGAFGMQALLLNYGFDQQHQVKWLHNSPVIFSLIFVVGFSIITEGGQSMVPGRMMDYRDLVANCGGGVLGVAFYYIACKFVPI